MEVEQWQQSRARIIYEALCVILRGPNSRLKAICESLKEFNSP